jgi:cbb3-type cytochrome oxidase maturation protein
MRRISSAKLPEGENIMESLFILVPLSVLVVFIAIWVFFRASDSGQFDDMVGPALRILQDDDRSHTAQSDSDNR